MLKSGVKNIMSKSFKVPTLIGNFYRKPINLDITNRCPLECPACMRQGSWYDKIRYKYKEMSISELLTIIKTFYYIEFCGQQSDPLAHPDILEFIFLCRGRKLDIHTATSHKSKEFYKEAFEMSGKNTTWIFGLDGLPEESHKYRINQNGVHLFEMMKMGVSMGVNICWQYIVFNYNQDHISVAEDMSEKEGIEFRLTFSSRWDTISFLKPTEQYCA